MATVAQIAKVTGLREVIDPDGNLTSEARKRLRQQILRTGKDPREDGVAEKHIQDFIGSGCATFGDYLEYLAAKATKPVDQVDLVDLELGEAEPPAGPTPEEQIEETRQAVADAEKFIEMCRKFGTGIAEAEAKLAEAKAELAKLTGEPEEEEEEAEVPLPVFSAQGAINVTSAGYIGLEKDTDLKKDTRATLVSLPWEQESSRDGKPRHSVYCRVETGYTPGAQTFVRVWGATTRDSVNQVLQSGKLGLRFISGTDPGSGRPYVIWVFHPEFRPGGTTNPKVRTKVRLHEDGKLYAHGQNAMVITLVGLVGAQPAATGGVSLIGVGRPR